MVNIPAEGYPLGTVTEVRCRKCPECLRQRAREWTARAMCEVGRARRTWFLTLTLRPEEHFRMGAFATQRLRHNGVDFDGLSEDEQFLERHREINRELTKYIKRLRQYGEFRVLCVAERHKSGLPHYHLLLHETGEQQMSKRTIQGQWPLGFSQCKLIDDEIVGKAVYYVCKYLSKSAASRVRASLHYGQTV